MKRQPTAPGRRSYFLDRIIAVLELGARAHGEVRWLHLYYTYGLIPSAGLREPLQKHKQSILPDLQRNGRAALYQETLKSLARVLQEASGLEKRVDSFESWSGQVLKDHASGKDGSLRSSSGPRDAAACVQGYLDQRRMLQSRRPPAPAAEQAEEYSWQYHLGRTINWNRASNDPRLPEAFHLSLKDRRTLCAHGKKRQDIPDKEETSKPPHPSECSGTS